MRKQVTILSGLVLLAGTSFAQQQLNIPVQKAKPANFTPSTGIELNKPHGVQKADGDLIWSDPFDGTHVWTVGTSGQGTFILGNNSHVQVTDANTGLSGYLGNMASTTAANGFAFFNGIQYLINNNVAPQNSWVASEVIDLTGINTISLSFQQRYRAFNSDVTYVEFSENGGATWSVSEVVNVTAPTNGASIQNTITLDIPVNGTATGMIRFRWEEASGTAQYGSGYGWMVDDVVVSQGYGNNVSLLYTYSGVGAQVLQYSKFPLGQTATVGNISFGAEFKNVGYNAIPAALNVTSGAFNGTGSVVTAPSFTIDSLEIVTASGMLMPTAVGVSNFVFTVTSANPLVQTTDDTKTVPFEVTANTYAVDSYNGTTASLDGSFTGWASGSGDPAIGTLFEIFEDAEVGAIDIGIANITGSANQALYNGKEFFGIIYAYDGTTFNYVDETPVHAVVPADYGKIYKSKFVNNTVSLAPGLYLIMAGSYDGAPVPFAFSGVAPAGTTTGLNGTAVTGLASDPATPNIVEAPVVRLDFQSYVGLNELENVAGITASPNPFTDATEISFDLKADAEVSIVVTDLAGRTVMTIPAANYAAGAQKVSIDGAALNAGVYNYTLTVGNNVVTKRIVKK